jgi:hypothetical protein
MELIEFDDYVLSLIINECNVSTMYDFLFISKKWRNIALQNKNLCDDLCVLAASNGHLGILSWAYKRTHKSKYIFEAFEEDLDLEIFTVAIFNGHLNIMEWIYPHTYTLYNSCQHDLIHTKHQMKKNSMRNKLIVKAINNAVKQGHLHVIEWLCNTMNYPYNNQRGMHYAIYGGQLNMFTWFYERGAYVTNADVYYATCRGYLNIVKMIHIKSPQMDCFCSSDGIHRMIDFAINNGRLNILKWLNKKNIFRNNKHCMDEDLIKTAIIKGHLYILKWLANEGLIWDCQYVRNNFYLFAFDRDQFEISEWINNGCHTNNYSNSNHKKRYHQKINIKTTNIKNRNNKKQTKKPSKRY